MAHPFLSPEWLDAVREVRDRNAGRVTAPSLAVRMNAVVTDVPFGDGQVSTYVDTSAGAVLLELGALDDAEVTVTTDYDTARRLFVEFDPAIAMQAFMAGKIKVQGDMMKLIALQTALPTDDATREIAREIQTLTS